ncbi:3'-5' exonuclease [uncultured Halopseudomonas sp.]|uniref:3'-5' exonuclease n=1 Tax=uncultured Halopseudomonas sp. TaxID=2901193 RepID=UPI0030EC800E|tara:strand:- start:64808 stop:65518 length:711 start_codon:yes stop_codon:yes gene_type:complete
MEKDVNMSASGSRKSTLKPHPTKEEIALLPAFEGLQLNQIVLLESPEQFKDALALIQAAGVVGFDTESKPVFIKGGKNHGPDVVQIALDDRAYIVPIGTNPPIEFLKAVLGSKDIIKVGFGLKSDRAHLRRKFGVLLQGDVELTQPLRALGYRQRLGAKAAVAVVLGQNLKKSKSVTTSNWAMRPLQKSQLLYAANDAFSALKIFRALGSPHQLTHTRTKVIQDPCSEGVMGSDEH